MPSVVRIRPESPLRCGDYDLDAFVVELEDGVLDFRFELGAGLGIYWALPAGRNGRLRLALVDGAAFHVDEPELKADPFVFDLRHTEWRGELGDLDDGSTVVRVAVEASAKPPAYRCEVELRTANGERRVERFSWQGR